MTLRTKLGVLLILLALLAACTGGQTAEDRSEAGGEDTGGEDTGGEDTAGAASETAAEADTGETGTEGTDETAAEEEPPGEVISATFSNIAETPTLDPAVAFSSDGILFVRNVYEGLLEYAPATTELRPALATEWEVSDDGLTYTFTLREGVTFHDGSEFTAEAAAAGLERVREVNQGPASLMGSVDTITATDDSTLEITLTQTDVFFLGTLPKLAIVSLEATEVNATDGDATAADWFATNASGTGPYQLDSWQRNSAIELVAYDGYWQEFEEGTPTEVTLRVDPDISTAMQLLEQGEIDMMGAVGPDEAVVAQGMDGVKVVEQPTYEVKTLPLNVRRPPLDDARVREAIVLAFDYQAMVDFFQGYGDVPRGPLPSTLDDIGPELEPVGQDLERARELLAEAGYPDGGFTVEFLGLEGLSYEEFAGNVLQEELGELGITVEQSLNPWPQMVEIMSNPDTASGISFLNQSVFTNDPTYLLRSAYSSATTADQGGYNWSYYTNPEFDTQLDAVRSIQDEAERAEVVGQMHQQIVDDHLAVYVVEPRLAQPVREEWEVTYETLDYNYVVRFFYARRS